MSTVLPELVLPSRLIGRADLARMLREVEAVDTTVAIQQARVQRPEQSAAQLPVLSAILNEFIEANHINMLDGHIRAVLKKQLKMLKEKAPFIHVTFATSPDPEGLAELVAWVRREINPLVLVSVGLQPSLIGGVYLRTPKRVHDLSMRNVFHDKSSILLHDLEELTREG